MNAPEPRTVAQQLDPSLVPDREYLEQLESYQPRFDRDILTKLLQQVGMKSSDPRVYSLISMLLERKLHHIVQEVKIMQT